MLDSMYSEILLEHSRNKQNKRELKAPDFIERGHNPSCGDDLTLLVKIEDAKIVDASFVGYGCAISTASISIMIDIIKGLEFNAIKNICDTYLSMIQGNELNEDEEELLNDAIIFESLSNVPARVKCCTLGWHCLKVVLDKVK